MDLKFNFRAFKKHIDKETGNILFYRNGMKGLPDKVLVGDGFTVEIKNNKIYLIDIFNAEKLLKHLLRELKAAFS